MLQFEQISSAYIRRVKRYNVASKKLDDIVTDLQQKLATIENERQKLKYPYWTEKLLRPVLNSIKKELPNWVCDDKRLSPMGLGCRVSVFFCKRGLPPTAGKWLQGNSIYIVFLPGELDKGQLLYETGERTTRFQSGTIGEINGFNQITKPLESIEEAVLFLKNQIDARSELTT
ncbi:MAG: hypothetical protein JST19_11645 [Bacteroidetes bacterium]|nr:hypothetical protein [Bacteroidota bacterium]